MYTCENCGKIYTACEGILAEIKDNKIVMESCSPFIKLTKLCNDCVEKLKIVVNHPLS